MPLVAYQGLVDGTAIASVQEIDDADDGVGSRSVAYHGNVHGFEAAMLPPGGGHLLSLETLFTPYRLAGGWEGSGEPERWLRAYASLLEPGFLDGVRRWRVVGPEDYERDFSMPAGYAPSFAGGPLAAFVGRDRELTRYETPVRGLYLTGSGTFPGAGVSGAPGRNTAGVVLDALRT